MSIRLPNELINHIFTYIEGKHNKIIKNAINDFYDLKRQRFDLRNIQIAFISVKLNISRADAWYCEDERETYFKYTTLHFQRQRVNRDLNLTNTKYPPGANHKFSKKNLKINSKFLLTN